MAKRRTPQVSKFKMVEVESSNIKAIGHSKDTSVLKVQFKNGSEYTYYPIPRGLYKAIKNAESVGKTFNEIVRGNKKLEVIKTKSKDGENMDTLTC